MGNLLEFEGCWISIIDSKVIYFRLNDLNPIITTAIITANHTYHSIRFPPKWITLYAQHKIVPF
ncbi:hypothetical protein BIV59_21805 [Bacillus sp. MUM 13]|nr:hypothetical protein BIV59_21805 [Bacillus sp. MUM 13]